MATYNLPNTQRCAEPPLSARLHVHGAVRTPSDKRSVVQNSALSTPTGPGGLQPVPIILGQSEQNSVRCSSSTYDGQRLVSDRYQNEIPQRFVCGYPPELERLDPVLPCASSVPVQSPSARFYRNTDRPEPWMDYYMPDADPMYSPPICDSTDPSASFLHSFADYDIPASAVGAGIQQSDPGETNFAQFVQSLSVVLPRSEPTNGPDQAQRTLACQWLTNGALCNVHVTLDRRSIAEHLQKDHGIRPGHEKAREPCHWEGCITTLSKESLVRHILTVHLKEGAHCADCGVVFAREDSLQRHLKEGFHHTFREA